MAARRSGNSTNVQPGGAALSECKGSEELALQRWETVIRAVTAAAKAVAGAVRWLVDLWRQADAKTDHPDRSPSTAVPEAEAMPPSPALASTSTRRPL